MCFLIGILEIFNFDELNRDAKTGLYNTPMIYKFIAANIHRQGSMSVLFIDVDYFKKINDQQGHLAGDDVLLVIANILQSNIRSIDCAGRFGGEEFIVILTDQGKTDALVVADRLRMQIAATAFAVKHSSVPLTVTVSIGVAEFKKDMTIEQLLSRADQAMYLAKQGGRNRVVSVEDETLFDTCGNGRASAEIDENGSGIAQHETPTAESLLQDTVAILTAFNEIIFELNEDMIYTNVYTADDRHLFIPRAQLIGFGIDDVLSPDLATLFVAEMLKAKASSEKESIAYHSPVPGDERCFKAEIRYTCLYGQNAYFVCVTDITEQKSADEALRVSQDKFQLIAETTLDTIWVYNLPNRRFVFISPSIEKLLGYPLDEAMEMTLEQFLTTEASLEAHQTIAPAIKQFLKHPEESTCYTRDLLHKRKDGRSVWIEQTTQYRFNAQQEIEIIGVSHNIDERKKREEEVQFLYHHDQLTGLMNRNALSLKDSTDERNLERKASRSVIFMNLDDFSLVNDSGGYEHGDRMLKAVAEKLKVRVGRVGTIYRYGGDEFVVVIESGDLDYVMGIAKELMNSTSSQITIDQRKVFITTSIGICIQGQDGTLEQSVKNANTALYIAKRQKNRIVVYTPEMDKTRTREAILEVDMQDALEKGEFELHYQPIFDVNKGTINQVEALLRWNHPEFNRISPLDFIPIAERTKLIIPITDWIIKQACARIADWERIGIRNFTISINLSPLSFENRGQELMDFITRSITEAGIQPSSLKLEITESILMNDVDEVVKVFHALKTFGVKLALDDFGTGYSSFGYMKDLPLDILKLDRSLIDDIVSDVKEQKITESMITIIHGLGLEVVAEGVETREQLDYLLKYDCDYIQGYLFSRPLPRAEFEAYYFLMLEQRNELFTKHEKRKATKAHFELRPEWLSGHTEIDKQHESIMQIANGLINFALEARSKADMLVQVDYLLEHVAEHFKYEESVMAEIGYAGYDEHKNQHKKLLAKAHNLKEAYNNAEIESSAFFAFVMDDFTLGHLIQEDTKFFLY